MVWARFRNLCLCVGFVCAITPFAAIQAAENDIEALIEQRVQERQPAFTLSQIPEIADKTPITMVAEEGFWTEYLRQVMIPKFERLTGVEVTVISMPLGEMYQKQGAEMSAGTGRYDLLAIEAGWAKEWAAYGYTTPLNALAGKYDPEGVDAMSAYLSEYYDVLLNILSYKSSLHSIPYNNYTMGMHFRGDLFDHPEERAAFLKRYGYPLAAPKTLSQLLDAAQFFTRKKGDMLAGKPLVKDFYGVALMADRRPHINDEFSAMLWGQGGAWFRPVRQPDGSISGFEVNAHSRIAQSTAEIYLKLLEYAPPETRNWAFLESAQALADGSVAIWPFAYNNLWPISAKMEENIPGARASIASVPMGRPYTGAYAVGVAYDSRNPEAAYWLLKYIGSYEGQLAYALGGGNPCRKDVVLDPVFASEDRRLVNGAFPQSHFDMLRWGNQVRNYGHFNSTAMGTIYPELMKATHDIISGRTSVLEGLNALSEIINSLQNQYGEAATLE